MGQNGSVSHWAGIESANEAAAAPRADLAVGRPRLVPRLRRSERLVVGAIDGGAHVLQRRGRDLLLGSALLMLPMMGLYVLISLLAFDQFDRFDNLVGDRGYLGVEKGLALVAVVVQSLTAHIVGAFTAIYVVRYQMGGEPTLRQTLRVIGRKLPVLFSWWVLLRGVLVLLIGLIYLNNTSGSFVGLAFLLSPLVTLVSASTLFIAPVVVCEDTTSGAFGRARRLASTRFGAVYGFVWSSGFMAVVLLACITWLPALATSTGLITFGGFGWLAQGVAAQLALLIVMPFSGVTTAQMYLQTRVHAEGLDIVLAADRAFGRRS